MSEDGRLDRIIDLDRAAAEILRHRAGWEDGGWLCPPGCHRSELEDRATQPSPDARG
jgi:hypothetical protein